MTRKAAKTDGNHAAIRDELRALGYTVEDTSAYGGGWPDMFVSLGSALPFAPSRKFRGVLNADGFGVGVEVKVPGGELTPAQAERAWLKTRAPLIVAETTEDVVAGIAQIRATRKGR